MHPTSPGQTPSLSCTVKRQPLQLPSLRCLQPRRQPRQMCRQPWTPARPLQNKGGNPPLGNNLSKHSHRIATQKLSQAPYNRAGNNMLPFLSTPQLERGCTTHWTPPAKPCRTHKQGRLPAELSQPSHTLQKSHTQTTFSASSCYAASGSHCPLPNVSVGAVAFMTPLARCFEKPRSTP